MSRSSGKTVPGGEAPQGATSLACLDGGPPPAELGRDLMRLRDLPDAARDRFWVVLGAYLRPALDAEAQETIVGYCERHELSSEDIAPVVKATRFLFQAAARSNVGPAELAADIAALAGDAADELCALLLPWFDDFRPRLRAELIRQTIADHGKVVVGASWRLEHIVRSDRGRDLDTLLAVVTLRYREGDETQRITLHLLPEELAALRQIADEVLG